MEKQKKRFIQFIIWIVTLIIAVYFCILPLFTAVGIEVRSYLDRNDWRENTSPLPADVLADLCERFELSEEELCQSSAQTLGPDFYPAIREYLATEGLDYDDVEKKIGGYKTYCGESVRISNPQYYENHQSSFVCDYDLRGDGILTFGIFFYEDGTIMKYFLQTSD